MERDEALLAELRDALLAEFGARAIYKALARYTHDEALIDMLVELRHEQDGVIARVQALVKELGGRPKRKSLRRIVLANLLALWAWPISVRLPLRVCTDAEETRARWYGHFQEHFSALGHGRLAAECHDLHLIKARHARSLQTWTDYLPS
ncbi:MAG: hypothetical protein K8S98_17660 [Planctomycetes bacterium]|nr:hypothetical protein [Planctomycetota bacterium]